MSYDSMCSKMSKAEIAVQRMSTDVRYAAFKTYVDAINSQNDVFITRISEALLRGDDRIRNKQNAKTDLLNNLVRLAITLQHSPEVSEHFISESGFDIRSYERKKNAPTPPPAVVTQLDAPNLKATDLKQAGAATLEWADVDNAIYYGIQHRIKTTEAAWQNGEYNDDTTFTFTGLEAEKVHEFQVRALGPGGIKSDWSPTVTIYVS